VTAVPGSENSGLSALEKLDAEFSRSVQAAQPKPPGQGGGTRGVSKRAVFVIALCAVMLALAGFCAFRIYRALSGGPDAPFAASDAREVITKVREYRETVGDDVAGIIEIDGAGFERYLVMWRAGSDYYRDRDIYGQPSATGAVYLDGACDPAEPGRSLVVYGRDAPDGSMFAALYDYNDFGFFEEHKYLRLVTLHDETVWEAFAFYIEYAEPEDIPTAFADEADFLSFVTALQERSMHGELVPVGAGDRVLSLVAYGGESELRYILSARLVSSVGAERFAG
jgi:SrtB family sortase